MNMYYDIKTQTLWKERQSYLMCGLCCSVSWLQCAICENQTLTTDRIHRPVPCKNCTVLKGMELDKIQQLYPHIIGQHLTFEVFKKCNHCPIVSHCAYLNNMDM